MDEERLNKYMLDAGTLVSRAHNSGWLEGYAEAKREVTELYTKQRGLAQAISDWIHDR